MRRSATHHYSTHASTYYDNEEYSGLSDLTDARKTRYEYNKISHFQNAVNGEKKRKKQKTKQKLLIENKIRISPSENALQIKDQQKKDRQHSDLKSLELVYKKICPPSKIGEAVSEKKMEKAMKKLTMAELDQLLLDIALPPAKEELLELKFKK